MIQPAEAEEILRRLVDVPSVTGQEGPVGQTLADLLRDAGLEVELQDVDGERRNVVARLRGGDAPSVLFAGHMDVVAGGEGWVTDPFRSHVDGDLLYGRGSCDMKGGLAGVIAALREVRRHGATPPGDVLVACLVGEEEDLEGAHAAVRAGLSADMAVVVEPTKLEIVPAHKGAVLFTVRVHGHAAHASTPEAGANAIEAAAHVVHELAASARNGMPEHPLLGRGTVNVGTIRGGTRPYVVPDLVEIEVDRRILPGESLDSVCAETEPLLRAIDERFEGIRIELVPQVEALPLGTATDHAVVDLMAGAVAATGLPGRVSPWPAVSDASVLANQGAIPTVLFGPGDLEAAAHQPNEHVSLSEVARAADVYVEAMLAPRRGEGDG